MYCSGQRPGAAASPKGRSKAEARSVRAKNRINAVWPCWRVSRSSHHLVLEHPEAVLSHPGQVLELVLRQRAYPGIGKGRRSAHRAKRHGARRGGRSCSCVPVKRASPPPRGGGRAVLGHGSFHVVAGLFPELRHAMDGSPRIAHDV